MLLLFVFPYTIREFFASIKCRLFPAHIMWWAASGVLHEVNHPATNPFSPIFPLLPPPPLHLRAYPSIRLISHILSYITSVICLLLLDFSVQSHLLQLNLIMFQEDFKKSYNHWFQIMLITFAAPHLNDPNVYGDWNNGGNTIGGSYNNGNSGWGYHNNGYYGKRDIGRCIHWPISLMVSLSRYVVLGGFSIHNQGFFLHQYNADFFLLP